MGKLIKKYFLCFKCYIYLEFFLLIYGKKLKIKAPALSPDLNPIEYLWHEVKEFVGGKRCKNREELVAAIEEFRATITPDKCANYIRKLKKVSK